MLVSAALAGPQLAEGLRLRYRQAREAMSPVFRAALGKVRGEDPEDIGDELLAMIDGTPLTL
jgi:BetI-type transcriptional repressor, C-terminal